MNMRNSQSQASPASSFPEEGQSALDGSAPATEDEIRELQQIEDFFRQHHCLPENYRPLSEDADVSTTLRKETELDDWANSWDAFRSSPITSAWVHTGRFAAITARISWPRGAEHFDQPEETNCTDPTSGTGTSDGTAEVQ